MAHRFTGFAASGRTFPFTNQPMSAGTSVTAVAPLPITTTRLPA